ncbi:cytochrome c biogenesis protein CcdA [Shimia thalassica]|jgi:cytochrome c-type biogenesis protein|uniref:Thiol:disulfide interchange protein DsbD n=1 Tax=Shimia thalassica TaxID=1715693 RepID=A0A0P1I489_9RHOB|nr:cytochrome c biogenesis protein CcdA [Shimia thalassica]MBU2944567.1 cytochrome c biogenesis protein CcdA [Shimia thalassica]MDO6479617.1 cytochrome c biogenesis protein CcdA [Shimia thalassica]MDO6482465.1 cytochrome c biogenesis protein CcdA [Shimia thalassica]MDO6502087.1 cytochrome c biogenesis protein CcdA [Shimia thalassica]MDO6520190.1 cytochrome c biogenesis protein CcdA [Shimia thalassica]
MLEISFAGAALAGLLSFLTPCVLPMVPFYLCYMAGISMSELQGEGDIAPGAQRRLVYSSVFFALGVTTIFVLLGMGATALGQAFAQWRDPLSYVAAALLALFGLHFLGVLKIPLLYREAKLESTAEPTTIIGAYVMGLAFGFGWTPCVGPALASILMVASGMGDIWRGALLLLVYGLGMTAPFVLAALFAKPFLRWMQRNRKYMSHVEKIMGAMLLIFALLIATNSVNRIADLMLRYVPGMSGLG